MFRAGPNRGAKQKSLREEPKRRAGRTSRKAKTEELEPPKSEEIGYFLIYLLSKLLASEIEIIGLAGMCLEMSESGSQGAFAEGLMRILASILLWRVHLKFRTPLIMRDLDFLTESLNTISVEKQFLNHF